MKDKINSVRNGTSYLIHFKIKGDNRYINALYYHPYYTLNQILSNVENNIPKGDYEVRTCGDLILDKTKKLSELGIAFNSFLVLTPAIDRNFIFKGKSELYNIWMNLWYKLGFINEQGDSIRRLKKLHKLCVKIKCGNKMGTEMKHYNQCYQPEQCFCCKHYHKATKTKSSDYGFHPLKLKNTKEIPL